MSVIAHWLEEAGISTVVIGLVKMHMEAIKPPRALWVPFELGRPMGPPDNPELQREVLEQALRLVETAKESVLEEFATDDPRSVADEKWKPPAIQKHTTIADECVELKNFYQRQCVDKSRTSVGVAKTPILELAALVDEVFERESLRPIRPEISERLMLRLAFDDLKAYYIESALSGKGAPSGKQVYDWIWHETLLGSRMRELRHRFMQSDDAKIQNLGTKFIVPHIWRD